MRSDSFSFFASSFAISEVARRSESANTEEPRGVAAHERVGVDRDEQVGLDLARLVDAHVERQEVVAVARQQRAHVRLGVDQRLEAARDHQRDVLLARAAPADRARVLAAVPRRRWRSVASRATGAPGGLSAACGALSLRLLRRLEQLPSGGLRTTDGGVGTSVAVAAPA
jgi:hypothetical protein